MAAADEGLDPYAGVSGDGSTLRLVWPQSQGAGTSSVRSLAAEFPFDAARRGYAVGSAVLEAVLPPHNGPTAAMPVETGDVGLETLDGIEAKRAPSSTSSAVPLRSSNGTAPTVLSRWAENAR
jgi:hypothetical protein